MVVVLSPVIPQNEMGRGIIWIILDNFEHVLNSQVRSTYGPELSIRTIDIGTHDMQHHRHVMLKFHRTH